MKHRSSLLNTPAKIEPLEARIAPASLAGANFKTVTLGSSILLQAGDVLSTSGSAGAYLLHVEKGMARVFTQDLNGNNTFDFNEITGIAAGDGLRITLFADVHGDIVTNLLPSGALTDSDNNAANGRDGLRLLDSSIEKIELKKLSALEVPDYAAHQITASLSIFGNILAGRFGATDGGLIVGSGSDGIPTIGAIKTGTAAGGEYISFGSSKNGTPLSPLDPGYNPLFPNSSAGGSVAGGDPFGDIQGRMLPFQPAAGQAGGDIIGVRGADSTVVFRIDGLEAGDGGAGAKGGDIIDVTLNGDNYGGYKVFAGNGGNGLTGGVGGSILNFSDLGSVTSQIVLRTGDGGKGLTGAGGAGGAIALGTMNTAADIIITTGAGGDGFTAGGSGVSLSTAAFTAPDQDEIPVGAEIISTTRGLDLSVLPGTTPRNVLPSIGRSQIIDFNSDGFGDLVYSRRGFDKLAVALGDGLGGFSQIIDIHTPFEPDQIVVADFNNDGIPDIAVASSSPKNFGGVAVFLTQYTDINGDSVYQADEFAGSPSFPGFRDPSEGFSSAMWTTLPRLGLEGGMAVHQLEAGDFNGDGVMDLVVHAMYKGALGDKHTLLFLNGDIDSAGKGNGRFYAHYKSNGTLEAEPAYAIDPEKVKILLLPTVLDSANPTKDHLFYGLPNGKDAAKSLTLLEHTDTLAGPTATIIGLGKVDTDRAVDKSLESVKVAHAAVFDFNSDGFADVAVLAGEPENYLVLLQGDGAGSFSFASNPSAPLVPDDQNGIPLVGDGSVYGKDAELKVFGIKASDADGDGAVDDLVIYTNHGSPAAVEFRELVFGALPDPTDPVNAVTDHDAFAAPKYNPTFKLAEEVNSFDVFTPDKSNPTSVGYSVLVPSKDDVFNALASFTGDFGTDMISLVDLSFHFQAGKGGNATIGPGGSGGSLGMITGAGFGSGKISIDPHPLVSSVVMVAGRGGNGFTGGGDGGSVANVTSLAGNISFVAGNGGMSIKSRGGNGGDLYGNSVVALGTYYTAGNGGAGAYGGNGGSVYGLNVVGTYDAVTDFIEVTAGDGGNGPLGGGQGGSIVNLVPKFVDAGLAPDYLLYRAGKGGSAVSGNGGNGGSVLASSPAADVNLLDGGITIEAGDGGDGRKGGHGGSITDFYNRPTTATLPAYVRLVAGHGGNGTTGKAGDGGSVTNVQANAGGSGFEVSLGVNVEYNSILAGNGGSSSGRKGGAGGSILNVESAAQSSAVIIAAGAGGDGLTAGGAGGSVTNVIADSAANPAVSAPKVVIIAGDGGDAWGAAGILGSVDGKGGAGGSIIGFAQPGNVGANVDLIAGNGGSTLNHGTPFNAKTLVGKGGSIKDVKITGHIGNSAVDIGIKAYNDLDGDRAKLPDVAMRDFLETEIRNLGTTLLDDTVGNVGLVAGQCGFVKNGASPLNQKNGSVINLTIRQTSLVLSMVAGSVDSVASIQKIAQVLIEGTGNAPTADQLGADKNPLNALVPDYFDHDAAMVVSSIQPGYGLRDGAIMAKNLGNLPTGSRIFQRA